MIEQLEKEKLNLKLVRRLMYLTTPADLREAQKNDRAVAVAYGFENILDDEAAIVAELMKLYGALNNVNRKSR